MLANFGSIVSQMGGPLYVITQWKKEKKEKTPIPYVQTFEMFQLSFWNS